MTYVFLLKNAPSIIMLMTIQCFIHHRPCKKSCQIYSMTTELLFSKNGMKAYHNKYQFMILSPISANDIELKLDENTTLRSSVRNRFEK